MFNSQESRIYLIYVSGYIEVRALTPDDACSAALESVAQNPHQLATVEVTPAECPTHLQHVVEKISIEGSRWNAVSYLELQSMLPSANLDDVPF